MKNEKISRRSFLKASAVASALGVMAAAPAAHAAGADEAAAQIEEENCLLKKPRSVSHRAGLCCVLGNGLRRPRRGP